MIRPADNFEITDAMPLMRRSVSRILDAGGRPHQTFTVRDRRLSAMERTGIDAAATSRHNQAHFADADGRPLSNILSDDLAIVRDRLHYESRNNGDAKGMIDTLAHSVIGSGPTLHVESGDEGLDAAIQEDFAEFCEDLDFEEPQISLGEELAQGIREQCLSGEDFLTSTTDPDSPGPVKLRFQTIAAERLATPWSRLGDRKIRDGIEFDDRNRKIRYWVSRGHPRDAQLAKAADAQTFDAVELRDMRHSFLRLEPGQHRGFPWFTPALPIASQARRFSLAVLSAAETAADTSFVIQSRSQSLGEIQPVEAMDTVQLARNAGMTLPQGWEAFQFRPEQPSVSYTQYMRSLLAAQGRTIFMPYNVAAADSSDHNFASGRMDHGMFAIARDVLRAWCVRRKLRWMFLLWLQEARLALRTYRRIADAQARRIARSSQWFWRSASPQGDPLKEAKANTERLHNETASLIDLCSEAGVDWEVQLDKRKRVAMRKLQHAADLKAETQRLALSPEEAAAAIAQPAAVGIPLNDSSDSPNREPNYAQQADKQAAAA